MGDQPTRAESSAYKSQFHKTDSTQHTYHLGRRPVNRYKTEHVLDEIDGMRRLETNSYPKVLLLDELEGAIMEPQLRGVDVGHNQALEELRDLIKLGGIVDDGQEAGRKLDFLDALRVRRDQAVVLIAEGVVHKVGLREEYSFALFGGAVPRVVLVFVEITQDVVHTILLASGRDEREVGPRRVAREVVRQTAVEESAEPTTPRRVVSVATSFSEAPSRKIVGRRVIGKIPIAADERDGISENGTIKYDIGGQVYQSLCNTHPLTEPW